MEESGVQGAGRETEKAEYGEEEGEEGRGEDSARRLLSSRWERCADITDK